MSQDDDLVDAFWLHYALSRSHLRADRLAAKDHFWAWEQVDAAVKTDQAGVFELLLALVEAAPDNQALAYLGSGPLEDFVHLHQTDRGTEIDKASRTSERFAAALRWVW